MAEDRSFHGPARTGGRRDRRIAGFIVVLVVAFVGIAVAKPWGAPLAPGPTVAPSLAVASPPVASATATGPAVATTAPASDVGPLPVAFTSPLSPGPATWTGLRWRRLAPDDPLALVRSIIAWRRGSIAIGSVPRIPATPVWTSSDGTHWDPLLFGTSTTFWPGLAVLGVAELGANLVAATETMQYCGSPCPVRFELPVLTWTSSDGRTWTPNVLATEWLTSATGAPLVAVGPSGMLIASSGMPVRLAESADGSTWRLLPAAAFPTGFALSDLRGTATGYVAVGRWVASGSTTEAATVWSSDGRHWSKTPTILPSALDASLAGGSAATSLVLGRDGMIAVGGTTAPGADLWWGSPDGRRWAALPTFTPLGPSACSGLSCQPQPDGVLVGDGQRILAVRGRSDGGAWVSSDGRSWSALPMSGDIPSATATQATLIPGGVLLGDGTTTWFGEATD
jgi:hypothetical protein